MSRNSSMLPLLLVISLGNLTASDTAAEEKERPGSPKAGAKVRPNDRLVSAEHVEAALDMPCPNLEFHGEYPLKEVTEVFEAHWAKELPYEVPFIVDRFELELEGISSIEDISVREIKISGGTHTCRDALDLVFNQTSDPELMYLPMAGHLLLSTLAKVESEDALISRVYDLTDFLAAEDTSVNTNKPQEMAAKKSTIANGEAEETQKKKRKRRGKAKGEEEAKSGEVLKQFGGGGGGFGGGGGGLSAAQSGSGCEGAVHYTGVDAMIDVIQMQTSPPAKWFDTDGEGGQISVCGQYIVVRQTYAVHRQIREVLEQLQKAMQSGGPPRWQFHPATPVYHGGGTGGGGIGGGGMGGGGQQGGGGAGFFSIRNDSP